MGLATAALGQRAIRLFTADEANGVPYCTGLGIQLQVAAHTGEPPTRVYCATEYLIQYAGAVPIRFSQSNRGHWLGDTKTVL